MTQITVTNRLPTGLEATVFQTPDTVWAKVLSIGWGPDVKEVCEEALSENQTHHGKRDGYCYTVLYQKGAPNKLAGFAAGACRNIYYTRMIYTECSEEVFDAAAVALNRMIQDYMDELWKSLGARGVMQKTQRNELDYGGGKSEWRH